MFSFPRTYPHARGVERELERMTPRGEFPAVLRGRRRLRRPRDRAFVQMPVLPVHDDVLTQNAPATRVLESRRAGELTQKNHLGGIAHRLRGASAARGPASNHRGRARRTVLCLSTANRPRTNRASSEERLFRAFADSRVWTLACFLKEF